ncbi:MAG: hypothetical protein JSS50_02300, partial [Proteobacteria bacterium]|nr:hypothetical protein [Pseudomonadota bacterium]
MKLIRHNNGTKAFSLASMDGYIIDNVLTPLPPSLSTWRPFLYQYSLLHASELDRFQLQTIELDIGPPSSKCGFEAHTAIAEHYKLAFIIKGLRDLQQNDVTFLPQALVLRNLHINALLTDQQKRHAVPKVTAETREGISRQQVERFLKTLEEFLKELEELGIQSLELHCQDSNHYQELNRRLKSHQLSGKIWISVCQDNASGVVQNETIWPHQKIGIQAWQSRYAAVSTTTAFSTPKRALGRYMEDVQARIGKTQAELEVAVNIEVQAQVTVQAQIQIQQDFTIEQQAAHVLEHNYQSTVNFRGPDEEEKDDYGTFRTYRLDELLGIPAAITEQADAQEALTIGTYNAWNPSILTQAPQTKASLLYNNSKRYDQGRSSQQATARERLKKVQEISAVTYPLLVAIFKEYCSTLSTTERLFDTLIARCKTGEQFDLMEEIRRISGSSNVTTAALGKQAYSYVARQYVRFISGLTGAAPVHVEVLGDKDDITGISWQMLMHKHTLDMGLNSWHISESVLLLACKNYHLFKGGLDYNNLPLGFFVCKKAVKVDAYKARPSQIPPPYSNADYPIKTVSWSPTKYRQEKESNQSKLRIDPLANMSHQDPLKQPLLSEHYRALNAYNPKDGDNDVLHKDAERPDAITRARLITGDDPLGQYINYYRGLQDNPPPQPLLDTLYNKLPVAYKNDHMRTILQDMCGRDRVNYNILSIVAVYGVEALAGVTTHLQAIKEQNNDTYQALINCISNNTSRPDWSYLASPEMLDKLEELAEELENVQLARKKIQHGKGADAEMPIEVRKLEVKRQFLEAVLNSSSNTTEKPNARSAHTGNTDLETTMAAFEYFWTRFEAMTQSNDELFTFRLQQTLVARATGYIDGKRSIILDGLSGNAQTDLYRLYRILDHAAVKGLEMLHQQLIALNAEPEYEQARKRAGLSKSDGHDIEHPLRCSLGQHGAVYLMDVAKTFENDNLDPYRHSFWGWFNLFLRDFYDPIIITPEMCLLPEQTKGEHDAGSRPGVGSLAYYMRRLGYDNPTRADQEAILWRDLGARRLSSNDEKALTAAEIAWIRESYYQILAEFRPQYVEQILEFYFRYIITRKEYVQNYGDDSGHLAEGKIAIEGLLRSLKTLTERADCTVEKLTLILRNAEEQAPTVDQLPGYQHRMQTARYIAEINDDHDLFYANAQFLGIGHANIVDRCLKVWFAGKRADSSIRPILHGFEPYRSGNTILGVNYPNDPYWQSQSMEHSGNNFLETARYHCEEFLPLCVLCDATIPNDPRYWKRDLAGLDANMDRTTILTQASDKALQIMQFINLWLDRVDWEQVQNFKQVPYQTLCKALKGKTTYDECKAAMNVLFPGLSKNLNSLSDEVSWDELLEAADPAVTISGQEYKTWKTSQSSPVDLTKKQDVIAFISTAVGKIDTWSAKQEEKKYISSLILRHYLLCFIRQQEIRHESGKRERLGDSAKAYVGDMLDNLIQGDAYNFLQKNALQSINHQIKAKLHTLVRLQSMNLQKHLQSFEII